MAGWEKIVVAVLVLVGAGGWTVTHRNLAEKRKTAEVLTQTRQREIERLSEERTRLAAGASWTPRGVDRAEAGSAGPAVSLAASAPVASPGLGPAGSGPARTEAMTRLADLLEKGVLAGSPVAIQTVGRPAGAGPALPAYAINAQGQLAPGFGQLFGLDQNQVDRLQEKVNSIKQQVEASAMAGTTVQQTGENSYSLTMQPLANAAQSKDELVSAFKETLGEDGYRLFAALNGERVSGEGVHTGGPASLLAPFGGEPRTMTVTRGPNGFQFTFKSGNSSGSANGADLTQLNARLGPAVSLLPPAFLNTAFPARGGGGGGGGGTVQFLEQKIDGRSLQLPAPAVPGDTFIVPAK